MNLNSFICCFRKVKKAPSIKVDGSCSSKSVILVRDAKGFQDDSQTPIVDKNESHIHIVENQNHSLVQNNSSQVQIGGDDDTVTMDADEGIRNSNENTVLQNLHAGANCDIQHPNTSERDWEFTWNHWMSWDT